MIAMLALVSVINCDVHTDVQDLQSATRSARVTGRYGWTTLTVTAMKTRWKTATTTAGASETAITIKTSRSRATPI